MFAHENYRLVSGMPYKSTSLAIYPASKKPYQPDILRHRERVTPTYIANNARKQELNTLSSAVPGVERTFLPAAH